MKKFFLLWSFTIVFFLSGGFAQTFHSSAPNALNKAERLYKAEYFYEAAMAYRELLFKQPDDHYIRYQLAQSYRQCGYYEEAEDLYVDLLSDKDYPLARFFYATTLKINSNYQLAAEQFQAFTEEYTQNDHYSNQAITAYNGCVFALNEIKGSQRTFDFKNAGNQINTKYSEFGVIIGKNDTSIIVSSGRIDKTHKDMNPDLGEGFSNNYQYQKMNTGWQLPAPKSDGFEKLNTKMNDGTGVFTEDGNKLYFTSCSDMNDDKSEWVCNIYVSEFDGTKWDKPEQLSAHVNQQNYSDQQPTLSKSGDTMYFASNRPGGEGMFDIWYSVKKGKGENWSKARNMGKNINTAFIEQSPTYDTKNNVMFFSSDGHQGFGGLDVFMAYGKDMKHIRNVGLPFNSSRDDVNFVLGDEIGYIASNRDQGEGRYDIYTFSKVSHKTIVIPGGTITEEGQCMTMRGTVFAPDQSPAENITFSLYDIENDQFITSAASNNRGTYVFNNLDPNKDYQIQIDTMTNVTSLWNDYEFSDLIIDIYDQPTCRYNPIVELSEKGQLFEHLYFDFDKQALRGASQSMLDEIITFYKENPDIRITISGNTDNKGDEKYNDKLSAKRCKSTINYMVKNGVRKKSIMLVANGERKPIASNMNKYGRQLNRHVSIDVEGGSDFVATASVYILQRPTSLEELSERFNTPIPILKKLNHLSDEEIIEAYTPFRRLRNNDEGTIDKTTALLADQPVILNKEESYDPASPYYVSVKYVKTDNSDYYTVLPRNTLYGIARLYEMSVEHLKELNNLSGDSIEIGQILRVNENVPIIPHHYGDDSQTSIDH